MRPHAEVTIDRAALLALAEDALTGRDTPRVRYHPEEMTAASPAVTGFDEIERMEAEDA
jgi:hypothetical protein